MTTTAKRSRGRPPAGKDELLVSEDYSKLTVYMEPALRAQLYALSALMKSPAWQIIGAALKEYIARLPKADRDALDALAERFEKRAV